MIQRGVGGKDWIILMGAGLKEQGGTTMIYRSKALAAPWDYAGLLCLGDPSHGAMWECPLLADVPAAPDPRAAGSARGGSAARGRSQESAASAIAVASGSDIFSQGQVPAPRSNLEQRNCECVFGSVGRHEIDPASEYPGTCRQELQGGLQHRLPWTLTTRISTVYLRTPPQTQ